MDVSDTVRCACAYLLPGTLALALVLPASAGAVAERSGPRADGWMSLLLSARASIDFSADKVTTADLELRDVVAPITLRDGRVSIERGAATTPGGAVTFTGAYAVAARELRASLHSDGIEIAPRADETPRTPRLFPPVPFVPRWLPGVGGALELHLDRLVYAGAEARSIKASASLDRSQLSLEMRGALGDGGFTFEGSHVFGSGETRIAATANAVALDAFTTVREYLSAATLDGTAEFNGRGHTMRALAASVDGHVRAQIGRGTLNNLELERLSRNVLAMTLLSVIPFQHSVPQAPLECAALRLDLARGRSTGTLEPVLVARSDKLELIGRGTLDLGREQIALTLQPAPKTGLALGAAGNPRTVSITGSLTAPVMKSKAGDLLHESLAIGASLAANPLARAADKVFARDGSQRTSCAAVLGE